MVTCALLLYLKRVTQDPPKNRYVRIVYVHFILFFINIIGLLIIIFDSIYVYIYVWIYMM